MKANELRIGNLYDHNGEYKTVTPDVILEVWIAERNWVKPIALTEEWLLKFGLKREDKSPTREHSQYFSKWVMDYKYSFAYAPFREDWGFYHSYTDASNDEDNNKFDFISCGIKHVHQLQNIYFALTGEELKLNND
jgi:hypothetical protein